MECPALDGSDQQLSTKTTENMSKQAQLGFSGPLTHIIPDCGYLDELPFINVANADLTHPPTPQLTKYERLDFCVLPIS